MLAHKRLHMAEIMKEVIAICLAAGKYRAFLHVSSRNIFPHCIFVGGAILAVSYILDIMNEVGPAGRLVPHDRGALIIND